MDNQAVVLRAPQPPHRECADMDVRQQATQHRPLLKGSPTPRAGGSVAYGWVGCLVLRQPHRDPPPPPLLSKGLTQHLKTRPVPFSWVPSHRKLSDATSSENREAILQNNEVDKGATIATALPLPPCEPSDPSALVICCGMAPTTKKWVIQRRRTFGFPNVHWITWLPLKGTRRMLWLRWLWGNVQWEGCAPPPHGKRQLASALALMEGGRQKLGNGHGGW